MTHSTRRGQVLTSTKTQYLTNKTLFIDFFINRLKLWINLSDKITWHSKRKSYSSGRFKNRGNVNIPIMNQWTLIIWKNWTENLNRNQAWRKFAPKHFVSQRRQKIKIYNLTKTKRKSNIQHNSDPIAWNMGASARTDNRGPVTSGNWQVG